MSHLGPPSVEGGCGRCGGAGPCSPASGNSWPSAPAPTGFISVYMLSPPAAHTLCVTFFKLPIFFCYRYFFVLVIFSCHRQNWFCSVGIVFFVLFKKKMVSVNNKKYVFEFIYIFIIKTKNNLYKQFCL